MSTQEKARQVADQLLFEGTRPTQQNVRERLGTGSITTINKALNQWWQELGGRLKANTEHPMIPDPVADSAAKLWHKALAYAHESLKERQADLEEEYSRRLEALDSSSEDDHQELKELRSQCLRTMRDNERLSDEKFALQKDKADLENALMRATAEQERVERELKQSLNLEGRGGTSLDEMIELQVASRTLKEENTRLASQLDGVLQEKSSLQLELARAEAENKLLREQLSATR